MFKKVWLWAGTVSAAAAALAIVAHGEAADPDYVVVAACAALIITAENLAVLMRSSAGASPGFTVIMASIALLGDDGVLLGAGLVGLSAGVVFDLLKSGRIALVAFNCGQYALAALVAALTYSLLPHSGGFPQLLAAVAAAASFAVVNTGLVLAAIVLNHDERPGVVWAQMRPAMPNYFAFGLLGLLVGELGRSLGPSAIVLLAIPMVVGRFTFASFTRLQSAHESTIRIFIRLIEAKDPYTAGHAERVARYSEYMAEELGIHPSRYEHLHYSALMHDVGKLAVPNQLLNKPGRLTEAEYSIVRRHNDVCVDILGRVDFMRDMTVIASDRHGRFEDSHGRPDHDLILEAHIVAVADAFDAMTSTRSYRRALDQNVAFDELRKNAGTQFNPDCVEALIRAITKRGERYGAGHESDVHDFAVPPPEAGVGSAGLGDLDELSDLGDLDEPGREAASREATP